jgi:hypothetical protein
MTDPNKTSSLKEEKKEKKRSMRSEHTIPQSPDCAVEKISYVDVTAMIRSLQRTEGFTDCFRRGIADCDQRQCSWRQYCLGGFDSNDP